MKIARRNAAPWPRGLVNTEKSGSSACGDAMRVSSRGHRALERTNTAYLTAMFVVDLLVLGTVT